MKRVLLVWVLLVVSVTCFCQGGGILGYKMTDVKFGNNYSSTTSKVNFVNKGQGVYTIDGIGKRMFFPQHCNMLGCLRESISIKVYWHIN